VSGVVSVSAPEAGLGTEWLPHALLPLRREHPGLRVEIQVSNQVVDLARRAADIAIRGVRPSEPVLTARRVARVSFGLFAARTYLEKRPAPGALRELADHDLIAYEQGADGRQRGWMARWAPPERVVLATNSVDAGFRAARAGWGIAMLPVITAGRHPELARVLPETEVASIPIWLVTHAELGKSPRIRAVFQRLAHAFERDRDAFAGASATSARKGRASRP
jgi:DNA-binding transcriptional LysR family regulator